MCIRDRVAGVPPITSVSGVPSGWVDHAVSLTFAAEAVVNGAPVGYTEYRVGSGSWTTGTSVTVARAGATLSLIHISEPTRLLSISYAVFCLKQKNT